MQNILKKILKPQRYSWFSPEGVTVQHPLTVNYPNNFFNFSNRFPIKKQDLKQALQNLSTLKCLEWYIEAIHCFVTIYIRINSIKLQ